MPIVTFEPMGSRINVEQETTLFEAAHKAGLPVASSCNANFVCGKCVMQILDGIENLSPQTPDELRLVRRDKNPESDRISCQTQILGDCRVTTRYW